VHEVLVGQYDERRGGAIERFADRARAASRLAQKASPKRR
jgi:hypothetical protein